MGWPVFLLFVISVFVGLSYLDFTEVKKDEDDGTD